jgi:hypothetical protein
MNLDNLKPGSQALTPLVPLAPRFAGVTAISASDTTKMSDGRANRVALRIGGMAKALQIFKDNALALQGAEAAAEEARRRHAAIEIQRNWKRRRPCAGAARVAAQPRTAMNYYVGGYGSGNAVRKADADSYSWKEF